MKIKDGVIFGGESVEQEVSVISARETSCAIANFRITDICNIKKWWEKGYIVRAS